MAARSIVDQRISRLGKLLPWQFDDDPTDGLRRQGLAHIGERRLGLAVVQRAVADVLWSGIAPHDYHDACDYLFNPAHDRKPFPAFATTCWILGVNVEAARHALKKQMEQNK